MLHFVLPYYQEPVDLLADRLHQLAKLHPNSLRLAIADGPGSTDVGDLPETLGFQHIKRDRHLKTYANGHQWLIALLQSWLDCGPGEGDRLIWVDPDTRLLAPLDPPPGDIVGPLSPAKSCLMGGCVVFSKSAAEGLVRVLPDLPVHGYPRYLPPFLKPGEQHSADLMPSSSVAIWQGADELDIVIQDWPGLDCRPRLPGQLAQYQPPENSPLIHPDTTHG